MKYVYDHAPDCCLKAPFHVKHLSRRQQAFVEVEWTPDVIRGNDPTRELRLKSRKRAG